MNDDDKPLWQGIIETQSSLLTLQNTALEAQKKRVAELETAGRALLIDSHYLYSYYPNNFRKTVEEYFADKIKVFGQSEGVADE